MNPLLFAIPDGISLPDDFGCNKNVRATQRTTDMSLDIWKCHLEDTFTVCLCMCINVGEHCCCGLTPASNQGKKVKLMGWDKSGLITKVKHNNNNNKNKI